MKVAWNEQIWQGTRRIFLRACISSVLTNEGPWNHFAKLSCYWMGSLDETPGECSWTDDQEEEPSYAGVWHDVG